MSKKFLITLKPIDKFFFGGDMTFTISNKKEEQANERFSSYIIRSSYFPQQTSLLGMLRFLLLSNSDFFADGKIKDEAKDDVINLIGPKSFVVSSENGTFGQIEELGACFLIDKNSEDNVWYSFAPFDYDPSSPEEKKSESEVSDTNTIKLLGSGVNGKEFTLPKLNWYKAKEGYKPRLLGSNNKYISISDIFVEDRRIGIARDIKSGKTDNSGLFKQISYRFKNYNDDKDNGFKKIADWHFAFYVTVADDCKIETYSGNIVSVGGDNSQFEFRCEKCEDKRIPTVCEDVKKVVLQSPTYIKRGDLKEVTFFMSQVIPFRFMQTKVATTTDYTLKAGYQRSCKYELYAPGSVFYFKKEEDAKKFKKALKSYQAFRQIGYNEFK